MDFRSWLISQGHDVYMSALEDPESLVSVDTDGQELNFEDYAYVPYRAYAERRAYEEMSVGDILASYIEWSASEQQKQNDPAAGEKATVKLTTQELEQMRSVDIGAVAAESLPDVSGMTFDNALSRKERISRFLQTVKNPYCFCIGGIGVKIEFAESGPSLQDTLTDFLLRQKSGL